MTRPSPALRLRKKEEPVSEHEVILSKLQEVAAAGKTVYYSDLGDLIGLDMSQLKDRNRLSDILGDVNVAEHAEGRPMISAVAVLKADMRPGVGFFNIAHDPLGLYSGSKDQAEQEEFWVHELKRVYHHWAQAHAP